LWDLTVPCRNITPFGVNLSSLVLNWNCLQYCIIT
jgi:hypothetical protein